MNNSFLIILLLIYDFNSKKFIIFLTFFRNCNLFGCCIFCTQISFDLFTYGFKLVIQLCSSLYIFGQYFLQHSNQQMVSLNSKPDNRKDKIKFNIYSVEVMEIIKKVFSFFGSKLLNVIKNLSIVVSKIL